VKPDIVLIMGYVLMLGLTYAGLTLSHGTPSEIWSGEGFLMAFGGALVGAIACCSGQEIKDAIQAVKVAFTTQLYDHEKLIADFVNYAGISRKDGLLGLEKVVGQITDPFMSKSIQMAIDGVEPDLVEERLSLELAAMEERHIRTRSTFDTAATFSPAFGMIGTIMGLVLLLKALDDPSSLGPKMAMALLSTFYGVFACYAFFTPLAKKLERKHKHENTYRQMIMKGIIWLQTGDSPRSIESKLRAFLREKK
jgi:chemotaxis protein MotA